MIQSPQERFVILHRLLVERHPHSIAEAEALAASTVDVSSADADAIWRVLWDKPLFANARVDVAKRWTASLEPDMHGAWRTWGADTFMIRQVRPGIRRDSFEIKGDVALDLVARHSIALHRLYRIQGAAIALRARARASQCPLSDIADRSLADTLLTLQAEFGPGWGPITLLHALTDMGLAVKPDIHLVRTVRALGLARGISKRNVPAYRETLRINELVRQFLTDTGGTMTSHNLRYLDKVLMDVSRMKVLDAEGPAEPLL